MANHEVPYKAPVFKLKDQENKYVSLADYSGNWLVLYFYPKDDTPGCTLEACSFRDIRDDIAEQTSAKVVGISMDDADSHNNFYTRHSLNFDLLSDTSGEVVRNYGAWGKKMYGREGILRKTFLIDPKGIVRKVYGRVTPLGHASKVLEDLTNLISQQDELTLPSKKERP
jgi:peroxiredoxin Q/BCP